MYCKNGLRKTKFFDNDKKTYARLIEDLGLSLMTLKKIFNVCVGDVWLIKDKIVFDVDKNLLKTPEVIH